MRSKSVYWYNVKTDFNYEINLFNLKSIKIKPVNKLTILIKALVISSFSSKTFSMRPKIVLIKKYLNVKKLFYKTRNYFEWNKEIITTKYKFNKMCDCLYKNNYQNLQK